MNFLMNQPVVINGFCVDKKGKGGKGEEDSNEGEGVENGKNN